MSNAGKRPSNTEAKRYKYSQERRQMTLLANASKGELKPWHKQLALWFAHRVDRPLAADIQAEANRITNQNISKAVLKSLLTNPAFKAYRLRLAEEVTFQAREQMESGFVKIVKSHYNAIEELEKAGLHKEIAKFTVPILNRIWPEDQAATMPAQIISINLGGQFLQQHKGKLENAVDITDVAEVSNAEA